MRTRPFLSHKRQDRRQVVALKRELCLHGTGGWRDLDDLHIGELGGPEFHRVITEVTGGFIWYGTRRATGSNYINTVELPPAIARKRSEAHYPLIPLFLNVRPADADASMRPVLGDTDADLFFEASGRVRGRVRIPEFHRDVARRYARAAVASLDQSSFAVAMTALAEPDGDQDLTFDWRSAIDPTTRVLREDPDVLRDALGNLREALTPRAPFPEVQLTLNVPLPLAMLLGYEWRVASRLKLTIRQRTRSGIVVVTGDGPSATGDAWPEWDERDCGGDGPTVLALATTEQPLEEPLASYARTVGAGRTIALHSPGELDASGMRGLARHAAAKLRDVGARGERPHFLLAGPAGLATLIGAGSNANGAVAVPFWDGHKYVSPLTIGT